MLQPANTYLNGIQTSTCCHILDFHSTKDDLEKKDGFILGLPDKEVKGAVWILHTGGDTVMLMLGMCVNIKERCDVLNNGAQHTM